MWELCSRCSSCRARIFRGSGMLLSVLRAQRLLLHKASSFRSKQGWTVDTWVPKHREKLESRCGQEQQRGSWPGHRPGGQRIGNQGWLQTAVAEHVHCWGWGGWFWLYRVPAVIGIIIPTPHPKMSIPQTSEPVNMLSYMTKQINNNNNILWRCHKDFEIELLSLISWAGPM